MCSTRFLDNSGGAILLDELEDGINNEHLEQLIYTLKEIQLTKGIQILATTHSTVLLDYVLDDPGVSQNESVVFMFNDGTGKTLARNIFNVKAIREQLDYMYPGEIVLNTSNSEMRSLLEKED